MEHIEGQAVITAVADHLGAITQQITRLQYIPAIQGPDAIVQAIRDMGVQMNARIDGAVRDMGVQLNARIDGINGRIDGIAAQIDGINGRIDGIAAQIDGINGRVDGIAAQIDGINGRIDGLSAQIGGLTDQMRSLEVNSNARIYNGSLRNATERLAILRNTDNIEMDNFPDTPTALQRLTDPIVTQLLTDLNLPTNGPLDEKRSRLRLAVGLRSSTYP